MSASCPMTPPPRRARAASEEGAIRPVRRRFETLRSFVWLSADRVLRMAGSMVVGLMVARHLGPDQYGLFTYALAAVAMLQPLAELGLDAIARREFVARPEESGRIAGTVLILRLAGATLAVTACGVLAWSESKSATELRLVVILAFTVVQPLTMLPESWLQVNHETGKAVRRQWIALGVGAGGRLAGIALNAPVEVFGAILVLEYSTAAAVVMRAALKRGMRLASFDRPLAAQLLARSWPLAAASVAATIYMRIDIFLLGRLLDANSTGTYAAAVRLSELCCLLSAIAAVSVQPTLARISLGPPAAYRAALQVYLDLSSVVAYACALGTTLLASSLVRIAYGPDYSEAAPLLMVHVWTSVFIYQGIARSLFFVNRRLTHLELAASIFGAVVNVGLNLLLIPRLNALGAAFAAVAAQAGATTVASAFHPASREFARQQLRSLIWPADGLRAALSHARQLLAARRIHPVDTKRR